jgi:hypothetical protein
MDRRDTKPKRQALLYVEQKQGVTQLVAEIQRAVVSGTGKEFTGVLELRAYITSQSEKSFGHRVTFRGGSTELPELRAAARKMERMAVALRKAEKEFGAAPTFAEYVRRGMRAAGVRFVKCADDCAGRASAEKGVPTILADDATAVMQKAGRLEAIAIVLFGLRAEAA